MNAKFCLVLAAGLLVGALAMGNPFLGGPPMRMSGSKPPVPASPGKAIEVPESQPLVELLPAAAGAASLGPVGRGGVVTEAALWLDHVIPDPALSHLVVRMVRTTDGEPCWLLRDGRKVRRNPSQQAGAPLVVAVEADGLDHLVDDRAR